MFPERASNFVISLTLVQALQYCSAAPFTVKCLCNVASLKCVFSWSQMMSMIMQIGLLEVYKSAPETIFSIGHVESNCAFAWNDRKLFCIAIESSFVRLAPLPASII